MDQNNLATLILALFGGGGIGAILIKMGSGFIERLQQQATAANDKLVGHMQAQIASSERVADANISALHGLAERVGAVKDEVRVVGQKVDDLSAVVIAQNGIHKTGEKQP